jgi:hypothetical protein
MISPQPTRRRDGQNRFKLTLEYHPGRNELVKVVAWQAIRFGVESTSYDARQQVLDLAAETYNYFGSSFEALVAAADLADQYMDLGENVVDRLFPELLPRQLADVGVKITSGNARYEEKKDVTKTKIGKRITRGK